jgi:RNA polymerase sigma-70 factor (ECF subfamily)
VEVVSLSDAALVNLARAGDIEAAAGLFERYRPSLYAAAIALLRHRDDALDAVQETGVTLLTRVDSIRDADAIGGWLHAVLRNTCLMRMRRAARETPTELITSMSPAVGPEEVLDRHVLRDWLWSALESLDADERLAVMLRYFSRCPSYEDIATVSGAPIGTVRSRLHRARTDLCRGLQKALTGSPLSQAALEQTRRETWEAFYVDLHDSPVPHTYRTTYSTDVAVTDHLGSWRGIEAWSAHEREAIELGVRARIVGLVASRDLTILEIDFSNPAWAAEHCPPRSTFVHRLADGKSRRLDIHYV